MAGYRAAAAFCEALVSALNGSYKAGLFGEQQLTFKVYGGQDFVTRPITTGVSLYLYRIMVNGTVRNPPGRARTGGQKQPRLPLEVHFLLTVWAADASMQNSIAVWLMRLVEDLASIPAAQLNAKWPGVFEPHETVEIVPGELSTEHLTQLWDVLEAGAYQLSIPYVARVLEIESEQEDPAALVSSRTADMGDMDRK